MYLGLCSDDLVQWWICPRICQWGTKALAWGAIFYNAVSDHFNVKHSQEYKKHKAIVFPRGEPNGVFAPYYILSQKMLNYKEKLSAFRMQFPIALPWIRCRACSFSLHCQLIWERLFYNFELSPRMDKFIKTPKILPKMFVDQGRKLGVRIQFGPNSNHSSDSLPLLFW